MKRKIFKTSLILGIVTLTCLGTNIAIEKQNSKFNLLLGDIEAYAQEENGPGHYTGAINSYCSNPKNTQGCKNDSDPSRVCTYSIFCIK